MNESIIEVLAVLTACRDRDDLDRQVAEFLFQEVNPTEVRVLHVIDDGAHQRVQERILRNASGLLLSPPASDLSTLPCLADRMHWMDCALTGDVAYYLTSSDTGQDDDGFNCVFPVVCRRGLVGMIDIGFSGQQDGIEPDEAGLVHGVLRILRNHLSTLDYADRDTLTGLLNRRTFESNFAKRQSDTLSLTPNKVWISNNWLLMVDVDRFKRINDEFGHLFGDEVLLLVARILNQSFRGVAAVYRFGGEEFVVILEAETMEIAQRAADRFRLAMQNHRFPQVAQVTVSLGYTRLQALDVPASAVQRADAALYFAKSNGRNQCQCYEQLVSDGLLEVRPPRPAEVEFF